MTITRCASAASTPIAAPSSRAHSRIRSSSEAGCRIWLACARRAPSLRSSVAVTSTQAVGWLLHEQVEPADASTARGRRGRATGTPSRCGPRGRRRRPPPCPPAGGRCGSRRRRCGRPSRGRSSAPRRDGTRGSRARAARAGRGRWPAPRPAGGGSGRRRSPRPRPRPAAPRSRSAAELDRVGPPVVRSGVAAGAAHEPADGPFVDPAGGRRRPARSRRHRGGRRSPGSGRGARRDGPAGWRRACALPLDGRTIRRSGGVRKLYGQPVSMVLHSRPRLRSSPPTGEVSFHARRTAPDAARRR